MILSFGILIWIAILCCPRVEAAGQTRVFQNSSLVTKITSTYSYPTLTLGTHSYSTLYFNSKSRPRSLPSETLYDTRLDSDGNPVMYTTWYTTSTSSSGFVEATITSSISEPTSSSTLDFASSTMKWTNTSTTYPTKPTAPPNDFTTSYLNWPVKPKTPEIYSLTTSSCSKLAPGEPVTSWLIVPNTTVVTVTVTGNYTTSLLPTPEFTPPVYCPEPIGMPFFGTVKPSTKPKESTDSAVASSSITYTLAPPAAPMPTMSAPMSTRMTITVITTSKNAVTITTQATPPTFPGGSPPDKQTVDPATYTDTNQWGPLPNPPLQTNPPLVVTTIINADRSAKTRVTHVVDGITIVVSPTQAVIGGQVVPIGSPPRTITEGGDVFTVGPDQIDGPLLLLYIPTYKGNGGLFQEPPKPTTVQGVPVQVGPTGVIVGGNGGGTTTVPIQPGARPTTIVVKGETISIGPGGVGFSGTTITPPPNVPTNVVVVGGQGFTAIGSTVAVIGDTSLVYGPGIAAQTVVLNGEAITVGPSGVNFDGTTIGGPSRTTGTQYAVAGGLSISEVGSTLAVINGMTLTLGPGTTPMTTTIGGQSIVAGPNGLVIGGATLTIPFNPTAQAVTAGGITFSQVGASVAVIGDKTYTFGPGAQQTTTVVNGQTISIGPGGIGFKTTTFTAMTSTSKPTETSLAKSTSKKKSGAGRLGYEFGVWGIWAGIWTSMAMSCFVWLG
ncbi:hypothetical protein VTL71DRAFT_13340 [Oculimacula yallundae]|uniref:Uncharacterized protein n=1 Tax=Oculimacula yallundae TaxID=86028 RepID=A0ABR4CK17_9HELO